ncbi:cysteine dioxygenase family protein [Paraburkholderia phenazinium]|uniref:Cysteine dioxygenase type I n=1 Tax=Paraburkholderia phenazinium TaxID=60549 RepID=A0A1G8EF37_9BURK|nr:Cysteine dioxygenase type I [Paraburkholderia phenazinium]
MSHETTLSPIDRSTAPHAPFSMRSEARPQAPAAAAPVLRLCEALDAAFEQERGAADPSQRSGFALRIRTALAEAAADPGLLAPSQREGSAETYRRHLLAADPQGRYAIAALVWMPGQASHVHAHHTWCGYAVLDGTLSETVFAWDESQQLASETRTHPRASGAVSFVRAGRSGIHRLGNASDAPAVSLHIYGVEGSQIGTHVNDLLQVAERSQPALEQAIA